ncbi:hypothetical protein [Spirosoma luteolum]
MDLDKYRRPASTQSEDSSHKSIDNQNLEAPSLGNSVDSLRQKASRYRNFVQYEAEPLRPTEPDPPVLGAPVTSINSSSFEDPPKRNVAKGNKFKSNSPSTTLGRQPIRPPASPKKREPSSQTGVKIVYLEEAMREEYIQIAGYLMLKHRVKLTMAAYFCFLHDQAVAQQSDETFLTTLAQFVKRAGSTTSQ